MGDKKRLRTQKQDAKTMEVSYRLDFSWTIEIYLSWKDTVAQNRYWCSPTYRQKTDRNGDHEFKIRITPNGTSLTSIGHMECCLIYAGPDYSVTCESELGIKKSNGEMFPILEKMKMKLPKEEDFEDYVERCKEKAIDLSKLKKHKATFLQGDDLEFVGFVQIISFEETVEDTTNDGYDQSNYTKTDSKRTLISKLRESFDTKQSMSMENYNSFSDFKVICGKEEHAKTFNVHKIFLALGSPVFKAMLQNDCHEASSNTLSVTDVHPDTMQKLIHYMYTDDITEDMADEELLAAADKYQIESLKIVCESRLMSALKLENSIRLGVISHLHGSERFKDKVATFLAKHWSNIKDNEDIKEIKRHPDLLLKIMSRNMK